MQACGLSRSGPIPLEVVSPEGKAEVEDNVCILRELCPQIMGTLAFPAPPKPAPAKAKPLWQLQAEKGGWNSKVKLDGGVIPHPTGSKTTQASPRGTLALAARKGVKR